ncbi:hypothetical protein [Terriglobus sp.]|uniref:hypothetical protein n=1 Tax=Terriglobus sp. TaxID=1889013 RepID=UPI003B007825
MPASARITDLKPGHDAKQADAAMCSRFRLTAAQVRTRFATYHRLVPREEHDFYLWFPCWVDGTIRYNGAVWHFHTQAGHLLWTDWPDGQQKELGGVHDDDPSGN